MNSEYSGLEELFFNKMDYIFALPTIVRFLFISFLSLLYKRQ